MKKRFISVLLVFLMCLSLLPTAFADDTCVVRIPAGILGITYDVYVNGVYTPADKTELVGGNAYTVPKGSDIKIVFAAVSGYELKGASVVTIDNIKEDASIRVPGVVRADVDDGVFMQSYLFKLMRMWKDIFTAMFNALHDAIFFFK